MSEILHDRISALVEAEPGITMASLLERTEGAVDGNILAMIAAREIYVDLEAAFLGEPEKVRVFRSRAVAAMFRRLSGLESKKRHGDIRAKDLIPGSTLQWNHKDFLVQHTSNSKIYLRGPDGRTEHYRNEDIERFIGEGMIIGCQVFSPAGDEPACRELEAKKGASDKEYLNALDREAIVQRILRGEKVTDDDNEARKHRNWRSLYKHKGLAGLIFSDANKGNRTPRLDARVKALGEDHIKNIEKPGRGDLTIEYGNFRNACEAHGYKPCTYKTFRLLFKARKGSEQTEQIEGSRAAYQVGEPVDGEHFTTPVNGDRPWQLAHVDHTVIDLELRHSTKRKNKKYKNMGKAWISLMIDAYSRRVLAYYISFERPSSVSVMMLVRECVRRHGRLPECLVVDNGSEFHSVFFQKVLAARYNCDIQWRPPSKPRFGAIMERFIKTMNVQFFHTLEGNTKIMAMRLRLVTRKVNPKNLALWNLPMLEEEVEKFFYEEYDTREHSSLGQSPRDAFEDAIDKYKLPGDDPDHPPINYDENFILDILPSTPKGTAKAVRGRGVKIYYVWYKSRVLKTAGVYGTQVKVRYDPWNRAVAYAFINGRWETLYAPPELYNKLQDRSHTELKALSEEWSRDKSLYGKNFNARVMEMAERHAPREQREKLEKQREYDEQKREAARRTGRHLSVEDYRSKPYRHKPPASSKSQGVGGQKKSAAVAKTFGSIRRRVA